MNPARRIVVDTGVLVSTALRAGSMPALALEKALLSYDVCTGQRCLTLLFLLLFP